MYLISSSIDTKLESNFSPRVTAVSLIIKLMKNSTRSYEYFTKKDFGGKAFVIKNYKYEGDEPHKFMRNIY